MPDTLSTSEAAKRLGVTTRAIIKWIVGGYFPGTYKLNPAGKRSGYRIPIKAIESFEAQRRRTAH